MAPTAVDPDPTDHLLAPAPAPVAVAGGGVGGDGPLEVVINVSSSDTDSDSPGAGGGKRSRPVAGRGGGRDREEKKARILAAAATVPAGFLEPLPPPLVKLLPPPAPGRSVTKQFWKAGDYVGKSDHLLAVEAAQHSDSGMDHVRVHPKFLHSNATSHKWALGAFAELLDNSLDEVVNGATYVHIDMMESKKDGTRMLLIEDNGGGMNPDKMRHCMSLGYSAKSKVKNTIGQYGNGFKTSTMRLGADVLVFSRSRGIEGTRPTQSVGMLSYTFLRSTNKEDIIVPMIDYEKEKEWKRKARTTLTDWCMSLETIIQWSPYSTEAELIQEFGSIGEQGTRIIIYNLWEDDEGELELDFDADANDIQIRGVNRDQNKIQKANQFPNSKHFFTYRHSLRSYASILYLLLPENFEMILRGKKIEHHNIINDLMLKKQLTYKPTVGNGLPKDMHMAAKVTIGFVKDARQHIDIQGFNVYHKNRLIKPFWRVWTAAGSGGRGIIGVLEVNFVEPAHDKQDFERTNCLARLEARLNRMQKKYWSDNRHRIGYGINDASTDSGKGERGLSPRPFGKGSLKSGYLQRIRSADRSSSRTISQQRAEKSANTVRPERSVLHGLSDTGGGANTEIAGAPFRSTSPILRTPEKSFRKVNTSLPPSPNGVKRSERIAAKCQSKEVNVTTDGDGESIMDPEAVIKKLKEENSSLEERILMLQESLSRELQIERDKNKSLTERFEDVERQLELAIKEQETTVELFAEERKCRDQEEENLKKKLREASSTIQDLMEQLNAARNCCKRKQQTKQLHPQ
ncbi:protein MICRORCHIDIA 7-like isoform X1 [Miscanthus floridulus]|uniref:protein MICRORCHIDIA 7-like isoform X1 n=1 Tax=Miscanthus floridulus TaxID=154761 RepID=UPI003458DC05